ncbi:DUF6777 domain-containing protein [Streptomyces sp. NPDC026672]|uniref:DUF6777 domain-containing protein n=1 Tax=unclassified Streptomyces TaxID=2593676 RepID=UPI0033EF7424
MAAVAVVAVGAVVAAVVLSATGGGGPGRGGGGEVFLQAANETGPDPFTASTARDSSVPPATSPPPGSPPATGTSVNQVRGVDGGAPGLYAGTRATPSCDVERQIALLREDPAKNRAFGSVEGVRPAGVPAYLRSLTPVQLRADTRVTNHGYRDGSATTYQAVLQTGTAVLVDAHGVPRVRCGCTNPMTPPVAQRATPVPVGRAWPDYRPSNVVVVAPSARPVDVFVVFDARHDDWFHRESGDGAAHRDRQARPPAHWKDPAQPPPPCEPGDGTGCPPTPRDSSGWATPPSSEPQSPPASEPGSGRESGSGPASPESPGSRPPSSEPPESPAPSSPSGQSPRSDESEPPSSELPGSPPPSPPEEPPASEPPPSEPPPVSEPPASGSAPVSPASPGTASSAPGTSAEVTTESSGAVRPPAVPSVTGEARV